MFRILGFFLKITDHFYYYFIDYKYKKWITKHSWYNYCKQKIWIAIRLSLKAQYSHPYYTPRSAVRNINALSFCRKWSPLVNVDFYISLRILYTSPLTKWYNVTKSYKNYKNKWKCVITLQNKNVILKYASVAQR